MDTIGRVSRLVKCPDCISVGFVKTFMMAQAALVIEFQGLEKHSQLNLIVILVHFVTIAITAYACPINSGCNRV